MLAPGISRASALTSALLLAASLQAQTVRETVVRETVEVRDVDGETRRITVMMPAGAGPLRTVVALHGLGEARRGPERGRFAWDRDYHLEGAFRAFGARRIRSSDYGGWVTDGHLRRVRAETRDWRGVAVVMPYTPWFRPDERAELARWAAWVAGPMLDQLRARVPRLARRPKSTGVAGISLGGWLALEVGLAHPEAFGAVSAQQPAIRGEVEQLAASATRSSQTLWLTSSERDPFLAPTRALSERLREAGRPHRLVVLPGDHSYAFNRGPGRMELLRFGHGALAMP